MAILSSIPVLGPLLAGFVAGLIAGGIGRGLLAGFLSGTIGGIIAVIVFAGVGGIFGGLLAGAHGSHRRWTLRSITWWRHFSFNALFWLSRIGGRSLRRPS